VTVKTDLQALLATLSTAETANDAANERARFSTLGSGEIEAQAARRDALAVATQTTKATKDAAIVALSVYVDALP
jgi:hypothetical protein